MPDDYVPEDVICWYCGSKVNTRAHFNYWECPRCDVTAAKTDGLTAAFAVDTFKFAGLNKVHDEPYVDHVHQHVPSPA